jgi:hypothetical protein
MKQRHPILIPDTSRVARSAKIRGVQTPDGATKSLSAESGLLLRLTVIDMDKFLDEVNAAYAALHNNPKAWKEEQAERAVWDKTNVDGLPDK